MNRPIDIKGFVSHLIAVVLIEKPDEQVCYFNTQNDDQLFNDFVSKRNKWKKSTDGIYFQIKRFRSENNSETFDAKVELSSLFRNSPGNYITSTKCGDGFLDTIGSEMVEISSELRKNDQ